MCVWLENNVQNKKILGTRLVAIIYLLVYYTVGFIKAFA